MSDYTFATMPSVSISRSKFVRKPQVKTTFNLGDLTVLWVDEVLPGDTRSIDLAALVRMSTPIAPIMDNIYLDVFAFFVPNRIVWDHWKEFMGENNTSAGIPSSTYNVPYLDNGTHIYNISSGSYADYMGLPVKNSIYSYYDKISCLPFRGLAKIYNRWFRNENLIAPLAVQTGDTNEVLVGELAGTGPTFATASTSILKAAKLPDYFTKTLPYAQKSSPVSVPLGAAAPVYYEVTSGTLTGAQSYVYLNASGGGVGTKEKDFIVDNSAGKMFADLSNATAATINQLRYAFQLQKLLEKDALFGTRYWEILASHFGVTAPDASLQDPEYLGGKRININIDQVLSTAGYAPSSSTTVGQPGANSVSAYKGSLFTKSFVEHGHIFIIAVARHEQSYCQGIERMWTRQGRYDYYWPVFANLGAQDVKLREIYCQGNNSDLNNFGYQEAWAEYRYARSKATSLMNPTVSGSLGFWTLANNFGSAPSLGQTFIEQDRNALARALVTGSTGPDFIFDGVIIDTAVRPMPVYSIPGLIDHH